MVYKVDWFSFTVSDIFDGGEEKGFDIYQIIKNIEVDEYSKKQNRLLNNAKKIDKSQINLYLQKFEEGGL